MAQYRLVRNPNPMKDGKEMPYHARYVAMETVGLDYLSRMIADRSSFSTGVVKGVVQLLQDLLVQELSFGNNVNLEGIGTFSAALQCPPVMDKKKIRAESISFRTVNYKPSTELCKRLRSMPLIREPEEKGKRSFTPDERRQRMLDYLEQKDRLTGNIYMSLNDCSRACATRDLQQFRKEKLIDLFGRGPTRYYVKAASSSPITE